MKTENITERFATFLSKVKFEDFPQTVIEQTKKCILDFTGVAIAGAKQKTSAKIFNFFRKMGGTKEASVIKYGHKTSCPLAALINGSIAHGLELDDAHILAHAHPGVTTIPAALAMAEKIHSDGRDLLTAITLGYESVIRIGEAINPSAIYDRGIHTGALVGTFGASSAVGKLLHLGAEKMTNALGNCCLTPIAPFQTFKEGAMIKDLYGGWPSFVGTIAASMAMEGFTGPCNLLEGAMGFCKNASNNYDLNKIMKDLGEDWKIMGVYFKKHASCGLSHTAIDAALALVESNLFNPSEIKKVVVKTHRFACDLNEKIPKTLAAAQSSLPFCIALALSKRRVSLREFNPENIKNKEILEFAQRVDVQLDSEFDKTHILNESLRPSAVEVYLHDGRMLAEKREVAKGWPVNPLSEKEFEEKFLTLTQTSLSKKKAMRIFNLGRRIETLADITPFIKEFAKFGAEE